MDPLRYPSREGAQEVASLLGVSLEEVLHYGQDWEYTYPTLPNLPEYERVYGLPGVSDMAKRVLGCFVFQCLEDHMRANGSEDRVRSSLSRLVADYHIHRYEFEYWAARGDMYDYYTAHPEDGWHIQAIVREMMPN